MGRAILGVVLSIVKHWQSAAVYAAKRIIQSSVVARHAMWPFVKVRDHLLCFNVVIILSTFLHLLWYYVRGRRRSSLRCRTI